MLAYALCVMPVWLLLHLYLGIGHDSVLYTMQGLGHLRPDLYANDIFLRYGSQDKFTLFGALYGPVIGVLGVDRAAAVVTAVAHLCFLAAAWKLARYLTTPSMALLSVGLLVAIELPYGSGNVFRLLENFMTSRPFAEALVILSVWAALARRDILAVALIGAAATLHPLMAGAGAAWLMWLRVIAPHPRSAALGALVLACALIVAAHSSLTGIRMDQQWMEVIRTPYLTISNWNQVDASATAIPLTALALGSLFPWSSSTRSLSIAALGVGVSGIVLSLFAGDWLHVKFAIQGQPWRWMWLSQAMATILLPALAARLWASGRLARGVLALMIGAYMFHDVVYGLIIGLLAVALALVALSPFGQMDRRKQNLILSGALGVLVLALVWDIANRAFYVKLPLVTLVGSPHTTWVRRMLQGSLLPALVLIGCWWACFINPSKSRAWVIGACAVIASAVILPVAITAWTKVTYTDSLYQAFAPWRKRIPLGAEVLMPGNPLFSWVFLERPSYISQPQTNSALFSREASMALLARLTALAPFLAEEGAVELLRGAPVKDENLNLEQVCALSDARFIVTRHDLAVAPIETLSPSLPLEYRGLKLYQCGMSG
jgi:hypothetical protein